MPFFPWFLQPKLNPNLFNKYCNRLRFSFTELNKTGKINKPFRVKREEKSRTLLSISVLENYVIKYCAMYFLGKKPKEKKSNRKRNILNQISLFSFLWSLRFFPGKKAIPVFEIFAWWKTYYENGLYFLLCVCGEKKLHGEETEVIFVSFQMCLIFRNSLLIYNGICYIVLRLCFFKTYVVDFRKKMKFLNVVFVLFNFML